MHNTFPDQHRFILNQVKGVYGKLDSNGLDTLNKLILQIGDIILKANGFEFEKIEKKVQKRKLNFNK